MPIIILKDFISENAGPISIKFHAQLQVGGGRGEGGRVDGPGHMIKSHIWY